MKNRIAPVNRIPLEVFALITDYADVADDDEDLIAMTHVCRIWREFFISRSSLWTNFDCESADKTRVYLERSKTSPINLWLNRNSTPPVSDPLFQIIPHSVGRFKSLSITAGSEILRDIIAHLPPHAPLLEKLEIDGVLRSRAPHNPLVGATLFDGDLSSMRVFRLERVRTELPWRNMANLTLLVLRNVSLDSPSIRQLLDFFESAPRLRKIKLASPDPTADDQSERLVSLACLKRMELLNGPHSSRLLSHLFVPVDAKLTIWGESFQHIIEHHLPRSLDNLRNISNVTKVHFRITNYTRIKLSGPSGQLSMSSGLDAAWSGLEALDRLDTSKIKWLEVASRRRRPLTCPSYRGLLPLKNLRTLSLSRCINPCTFMAALSPNMDASGAVPCPKLEEIILVSRTDAEDIDIKSMTKIAAARASRGAKLRTIRIAGGKDKLDLGDVLELRKHVSNVECGPVVDVVDSDSDDSDEDFC